MYQHIVASIDESDNANLALEQAIEIAKLSGATLHLVHIVNLFELALDPADPTAYLVDGKRHAMERREVTVDTTPIQLTRTEFDLLAVLSSRPGLVFSRRQLVDGAPFWSESPRLTGTRQAGRYRPVERCA